MVYLMCDNAAAGAYIQQIAQPDYTRARLFCFSAFSYLSVAFIAIISKQQSNKQGNAVDHAINHSHE